MNAWEQIVTTTLWSALGLAFYAALGFALYRWLRQNHSVVERPAEATVVEPDALQLRLMIRRMLTDQKVPLTAEKRRQFETWLADIDASYFSSQVPVPGRIDLQPILASVLGRTGAATGPE